jgi:Na+-transporting NADH:ubiquinone oxidoreductase subunit NqrB
LEIVDSKRQLFEVVLALCPACRFTGLLNGRQQQGNQDGDDGNHNQQFDQCETATTALSLVNKTLVHGQTPVC